jgi:hypothetical protein
VVEKNGDVPALTAASAMASTKRGEGAGATLTDKNGNSSRVRRQWWLENQRGVAAVQLLARTGGRGERGVCAPSARTKGNTGHVVASLSDKRK